MGGYVEEGDLQEQTWQLGGLSTPCRRAVLAGLTSARVQMRCRGLDGYATGTVGPFLVLGVSRGGLCDEADGSRAAAG